MNVLTILGSPKKNGKTAEVLSCFEEIMTAKGHTVERMHLSDYRINGCLGCFACMRNTSAPGCIQKDDANEFFKRFEEADAIVYSSPVFCFDMSAQLKTLIDRQFCLLNTTIPNGKRTALVLTCRGLAKGNADLATEVFRRCFDGEHGGKADSIMFGQYIVDKSSESDFSERALVAANQMACDILE